MKRALVLSCLIVGFAASPASAAGAFDPVHDVRFTLNGNTLTVSLVPDADGDLPAVRRRLWGIRIDAACSSHFKPRRRSQVVMATRRWPRGLSRLSFTFPRDISRRVAWCLLEDDAEDLAGANFRAFIRVYAGGREDRRIGQDARRRLLENAWSEPWLERVKAIVVDAGAVAVVTDLRRTQRAERIARRLCSAGADAIYGRNELKLRSCLSPGS